MNHRRLIIIGAAVAFAVIAFAGNLMYLNSADARANKNVKRVDIFAVKAPIKKGMTGQQVIEQELVETRKIPQELKPETAVLNLDDLRKEVAVSDLTPGQLLVAGQFADPSAVASTFAGRIPAGQVAVSISVDQVHAVAGFVQPGDKVNVLVFGKDPNSKDDHQVIRVLYQNVNVIAVGPVAALQPGETKDPKQAAAPAFSSLITLSVPLDAAERIILPASGANGSILYLTLVPSDSTPSKDRPPVFDLKNAYDSAPITPYE
jgi:pilus assembly protein CpaB